MSQDELDLVLELFVGGQLMGPAFRIARCRSKRIISVGVHQFNSKDMQKSRKRVAREVSNMPVVTVPTSDRSSCISGTSALASSPMMMFLGHTLYGILRMSSSIEERASS